MEYMDYMDWSTWNTWTGSHGIHGLVHMEYMDWFTWNTWTTPYGIHGLVHMEYKFIQIFINNLNIPIEGHNQNYAFCLAHWVRSHDLSHVDLPSLFLHVGIF